MELRIGASTNDSELESKSESKFALERPGRSVLKNATKLEFTNIECTVVDKIFVKFDYCYIKAVNRSYKYISLKANMLELPLSDPSASLQILRRFRKYTPVTMNATFDVCKFMSSQKSSRNPMLSLFADIAKAYTNVYHKCPYDHDLVIDKLPASYLNQHFLNILFLPPGEYAFYSSWYTKNVERAKIKIYGTLSWE
ncbi:uncharacterized protein [Drosophila bipectinata]|uniref:uncharacterized protein n=1 Tax=Drosophila bipectinata TaxID=42026 RepID=UPI0038B266DB